MSTIASFRVSPSANLFSRMMVSIDRMLMAHARIAIRNGDLPYFGLWSPSLLRWTGLYRSRVGLQAFLPDWWPRFSGAIFFISRSSLDGRDDDCDKLNAPAAPAD